MSHLTLPIAKASDMSPFPVTAREANGMLIVTFIKATAKLLPTAVGFRPGSELRQFLGPL